MQKSVNRVRTRFAPSPSGFVHLGGIRTALFAYALAKHNGGDFILRVEDTDRTRLVEGAVENIMHELRALGLQWDEGPDIGGPCGPYTQSERLSIYTKYAEQLIEEGHAYRCFCNEERLNNLRQEQEVSKQKVGYDRLCRNLSKEESDKRRLNGEPYVIRIKLPLEGRIKYKDALRGEIVFNCEELQDFVGIKTDGYPTYSFANVIDDHTYSISHIIRGEEFLSSTPLFVHLYNLFGWEPPVMAHVPLVLGADKKKLSKRNGDTAIADYRQKGYLPEALINMLAHLGWSPPEDKDIFDIDYFVENFSIDRLQKSAATFDMAKLDWMNSEYIKNAPFERIFELGAVHFFNIGAGDLPIDKLEQRFELIRTRIKTLSEIENYQYLFNNIFKEDADFVNKVITEEYEPFFRKLCYRINKEGPQTKEEFETLCRTTGEEFGFTGGALTHPLRAVLTGQKTGPGLFELMEGIGFMNCQYRILKRFVKDI